MYLLRDMSNVLFLYCSISSNINEHKKCKKTLRKMGTIGPAEFHECAVNVEFDE